MYGTTLHLIFFCLSGARAFISLNINTWPANTQKVTTYTRITYPLEPFKTSTAPPTTIQSTQNPLSNAGTTRPNTGNTNSLSSSQHFNPANCGISTKPKKAKIIGGVESKYLQWPWMVSVELRNPVLKIFTHKCGGFIINNHWVMTAAHCIHEAKPKSITLRFAEHDLSHENELHPHFRRNVTQMIIHSSFKPETFENDIALLKLDRAIEYGPAVAPLCLASKSSELFINETATVVGWGQTDADFIRPFSVLRHTTLRVLSNLQCLNQYATVGYQEDFPSYFLCAAEKDKDSCEGDSGGPLMVKTTFLGRSRWMAIGIVSWGMGCAIPNQPGVYTRMTEYTRWVGQMLSMY